MICLFVQSQPRTVLTLVMERARGLSRFQNVLQILQHGYFIGELYRKGEMRISHHDSRLSIWILAVDGGHIGKIKIWIVV